MKKSEYKSIDTNSLRLFLAVYETGSLTGAAKLLGVNQSTASHGLQKLRKIFDDQLFVKSGRGIVPTDRVIELIPRIRKLLPDLTNLLQTQSFDPAEETKPIVIGTNGCGRLLITQQIFGAEEMNGLSLKFIDVGTGRNVEDILIKNKADVAIAISNNKISEHIHKKSLFKDTMRVYYDPEQGDAPKDIAEYCSALHATIDFDSDELSMVDVSLGKIGVNRTVALRVANIEVLPHLMKGTKLITTMPRQFSQNLFSDLAQCEPPIQIPPFSIDMMWHVRSDNSPRNRWLQKLIMSTFEK